MKLIREWSEAIIIAVILTLIIRFFIVQAFKIPSSSMEDTLLVGDYLLVNKFIYGSRLPFSDTRFLEIRDPQRGDVIVFKFPSYRSVEKFNKRNPGVPEPIKALWLDNARASHRGEVDFIKRVVAVPGDVVFVKNKQLYVNGVAADMPNTVHKDSSTYPSLRDYFGPVTVPEDRYFVMGDNRDYSLDSRFWGFVPRRNILGLAFVKYWSWDRESVTPRFDRIGRPID